MKGPDIDEEIKNGEKAIKVLGGKIEKIEKFTLPETDMKRSIVIIKKVNFTPRNISQKAWNTKQKSYFIVNKKYSKKSQ